MNQQGFQNQQQFNQANRYQPVFNQAQNQNNFAQSSNPVIAHAGLTAQNQQFSGMSRNQSFSQSNSRVLDRVGLTANQQNIGSQGRFAQQSFNQSSNPVISHAGLTASNQNLGSLAIRIFKQKQLISKATHRSRSCRFDCEPTKLWITRQIWTTIL